MSFETARADKPQLNPHPLSSYVAWAGNRNRDPILSVLKEKLPTQPGKVLEIASGSGMHLHYFAPHFPQLQFQPSDLDEEVFDNIKALTEEKKAENVHSPIKIDLSDPETWFGLCGQKFEVIFCINIFQVAPVSIAKGMMQCADELLAEDGFLLIYGPFKVNGQFSTQSNAEFDQTLRSYGVSE